MPDKQVDTAIEVLLGPCIDDTDFKSREESITWNQAGMEIDAILEKHDGTITVTAITPTTSGVHDWTHTDQGYYKLEIPASGGNFNNDTEGTLRVVGFCTGVLPFRSIAYDIVNNKHVHYVSKSGNDSNHGHSISGALLTIGQAITNAVTGDKIIIHPGDYDETVDPDTANIAVTLIGTSRTVSKIVPAVNDGLKLETGCTVENLAIEAVGLSIKIGIRCLGPKHNIVLRDLDVLGYSDGIYCRGDHWLVQRCQIDSKYDAVIATGAFNILMEDCSLNSVPEAADEGARVCGLYALNSNGVFRNLTIDISRDDASAFGVKGAFFESSGSTITLINCTIVCSDGSSNTGNVYGIHSNHADNKITLIGCTIVTTCNGSGNAYDIYNQAGTVVAIGCNYSTSSGIITEIKDKTGFKLAADGLDSVSTAEPASVASNFREMLVQTWRRWLIKTELDEEAGTLKTYKDNDTVCTTQTVEETGGVQTVEDAS